MPICSTQAASELVLKGGSALHYVLLEGGCLSAQGTCNAVTCLVLSTGRQARCRIAIALLAGCSGGYGGSCGAIL